MTHSVLSPMDLVFANGDQLKTDSQKVAKAFSRNHKNVLRAIDNLKVHAPASWFKLNFEPADYIDKNGDLRRMVIMSKDGFMLLVMGFTGALALEIKIAYIQAFNFMEAQLKLVAQYVHICHIEKEEKSDASDCGRGLNAWKIIKKELFNIKNGLVAKIQPDLFDEVDE